MILSAAWSLGIIATSTLLLPVAASSSEAGFLALPLTKHQAPGLDRLNERQAGQPLTYGSGNETYLVEVEIGSPKQKVQLAVDIMFWDTFVLGNCSREDLDDIKIKQCESSGLYDVTASDTIIFNLDGDNEQNGTVFESDVVADDFTIGGYETIKSVLFFVETDPYTTYFGSIGLDFARGFNTRGPGFMDHLVDQNIIASKSFALTLGGDDDSAGSLVFGGLDTKKFAGSLHKMLINRPPEAGLNENEYHYWMQLDGVTLDDGAGNITTAPGFTFVPSTIGERFYIPGDVASSIASAFGVYDTIPERTSYMVDCDLRDSVNGSVSLEFPGGLNVSIPYREFVTQRGLDGELLEECYILSTPRSEDQVVWALGHPFLRRVYALFDQDEGAIWLAKYQDCGSEVVKFDREEEIRGQCEEGSGSGGSESSNDENDGSGTSNDDSEGSESPSGGTQDGADNGNGGARIGVSIGAAVFAAALSLSWL